jgi:hypothetical protein
MYVVLKKDVVLFPLESGQVYEVIELKIISGFLYYQLHNVRGLFVAENFETAFKEPEIFFSRKVPIPGTFLEGYTLYLFCEKVEKIKISFDDRIQTVINIPSRECLYIVQIGFKPYLIMVI